MKKLTFILLLFAAIIITSCEGPMGSPGIPGEDGTSLIGTVFEMQGDFKTSNNYELFFDFPQDFKIYDTDVALVYILWDVVTINGKDTDIWRLLPQTIILDEGILQYNFDYTVNDVRIFLEATIPYNELLPAETQNQVFRIAVLPADFVASKKSAELIDLDLLLNSPELKYNVIAK